MKKFKDKNDIEIKNGDIIDLHQTVNGSNIFIILNIEPLDIRYGHDLNYKYQYDQTELLSPCKFSGVSDFEIISNIYTLINDYR